MQILVVMLLAQFLAKLLLDVVDRVIEDLGDFLLQGFRLLQANQFLDHVLHQRLVVNERVPAKVQCVMVANKPHGFSFR